MGFYTPLICRKAAAEKEYALGLWQIDTHFKSKFYPTF
jgi:hypothetical protein